MLFLLAVDAVRSCSASDAFCLFLLAGSNSGVAFVHVFPIAV